MKKVPEFQGMTSVELAKIRVKKRESDWAGVNSARKVILTEPAPTGENSLFYS